MIVGDLTTYHTQYTWDMSVCIFLFNRTTLQVFVTYLTGALYVHPLWFYKHQNDNRVRSKLCVACQRWWFQWRFWFVPSVPGYLREEEEHKSDPWRNPVERNHMGLHLEKLLLKPRQSFWITLYLPSREISMFSWHWMWRLLPLGMWRHTVSYLPTCCLNLQGRRHASCVTATGQHDVTSCHSFFVSKVTETVV